jgi:hypothetical protein
MPVPTARRTRKTWPTPLRMVVAPVAGQREAVAGINQASLEHTTRYYQQIDLLPAITFARN